MKMLAASPLLAQITAKDLSAKSLAAVGLAPKENVYTRIGVRTVINCRGTWTYLSGSLEFPEVREAQIEAGHHFVNMVELQQGVGRKLAGAHRRRIRHDHQRRCRRHGHLDRCLHGGH